VRQPIPWLRKGKTRQMLIVPSQGKAKSDSSRLKHGSEKTTFIHNPKVLVIQLLPNNIDATFSSLPYNTDATFIAIRYC